MADPTTTTSVDLLSSLADPELRARAEEGAKRLTEIQKIVQEQSAIIAKQVAENNSETLKKITEETFKSLTSFKEYLADLSKSYGIIEIEIENKVRDLMKQTKANEIVQQELTKNIEETTNELVTSLRTSSSEVKALYELYKNNATDLQADFNQKKNAIVQNEAEIAAAIATSSKASEEYAKIQEENIRLEKEKQLILLNPVKTQEALRRASEIQMLININKAREQTLFNEKIEAELRRTNHEEAVRQIKENNDYTFQEQALRLIGLKTKTEETEVEKQLTELEAKLIKLKQEEALANVPLLEMDKMRTKGLQDVNSKLGDYVNKLMPGSAKETNIFGSALLSLQFATEKTGNGFENLKKSALAGMREAFLDPQAAANSLFNLINEKLIKSTFEFDKALASVNKETGGFGKEFEKIATRTSASGLFQAPNVAEFANLGMNLEKVGKVYSELSKNVLGFNQMTEASRKELLKTSADLSLLGVSAQTSGQLASKFMSGFSQDARGASEMMKQVAKDAIALGQDVGKYAEGLNTALSKVSGYAREATEIYKQLQAVSQATKGVISVSDLTGLSDKFATFDTAAESVSKLNAMLGGTSLNIMDMMQKDPAEQIMAIKRAASESGLAFDSLNIGYKRLLAEYFGGDIAKAAAFFKMDLQEANALMTKASATEKELEERKQASVAAQEKMKATMDQFMLSLTPLINIVNGAMSAINSLVDSVGVIPVAVGIGFLAFMRVKMAVVEIKQQAVEAGKKFKESFTAVRDEIARVEAAITRLSTALDGSAEKMAKFKKAAEEAKAQTAADSALGRSETALQAGAPAVNQRGFKNFVMGNKVAIVSALGLGALTLADSAFGLGKPPVEGRDIVALHSSATGEVKPMVGVDPKDNIKIEAALDKNKLTPNPSITNVEGSNNSSTVQNIAIGAGAAAAAAYNAGGSPIVSELKQFSSQVATNSEEINNLATKTSDNQSIQTLRDSTKILQDSAIEREKTDRQMTSNALASSFESSADKFYSRETNTQTMMPMDGKITAPISINLDGKLVDTLSEVMSFKMNSKVG